MSRSDIYTSSLELIQLAAPTSKADVAAITFLCGVLATYLFRGVLWDKPDPYHHVWFERPQADDGEGSARQQAARNIAERLDELNKEIVIFWGSQSGTSEAFANRLARECQLRFGLEVLSADLSDFDAETIALIPSTKFAIFILSTFGEGDPSDNAAGFWEWIQKGSEDLRLPNLRWLAFGLGNSNYKYYNRVVDVVAEKLDSAGAKCLLPIGRADDADGGTEESFLAWKDQLYEFFVKELGYHERQVSYTPSLTVSEDCSLDLIDLYLGDPLEQRGGTAKVKSAYSPIKILPLQVARQLTDLSEAGTSCLHVELDLGEHAELRYRTGDHLATYPINPDQEVQLLIQAIGIQDKADAPLLLRSLHEATKLKLPSPTTASALFRHYLEICAPVSRDTIRELIEFAPTNEAKVILNSVGKDKLAYANFVSKNHLTIGRLLSLIAPNTVWKDLPLTWLLETIPPLQPRYYSISSSSMVSPRKLTLTMSVEKAVLTGNSSQAIRGLNTNYVAALSDSLNGVKTALVSGDEALTYNLVGPAGALEGHKLYACIRKSKFKLPTLASTPIIMVAAGTGIAPFRGFILERARLKAIGKPLGRMLLFFGCRWADKDYLYREELAELVSELGGDLEIITAFSRQQPGKRVYVQDRIRERGKEVCGLMNDSANFYICGRASMAREVGKVVEESMAQQSGMSDSEVRSWSSSAKKGNKWLEDVWG